jgi:hypothetical protein
MDSKTKSRLHLALELAEPKLIAGEVDVQLSSRTNTKQQSTTFSSRGVLSDISVDVAVDDVIAYGKHGLTSRDAPSGGEPNGSLPRGAALGGESRTALSPEGRLLVANGSSGEASCRSLAVRIGEPERCLPLC